MKKKIVIIGATSTIAQHCARIWLESSPAEVLLVGRNLEKIGVIAKDLRVRSPESTIDTLVSDLLDPVAIEKITKKIFAIGAVDLALIAHGFLPDQKSCETDLSRCQEALLVNGVSPLLFAESFVTAMLGAGRGTLAIIGSVAGDRGRKSNYIYGAAKGMVERYVEGLQHRTFKSPVKVVLVKPGPTATPMTANLTVKQQFLAEPQEVASDIVFAMQKGQAVLYTPRKWAIIMKIIKSLPRFIFNRIEI